GLLEKLRLDCEIEEVAGPFYAVNVTNASGSTYKELRTQPETLAIIGVEEIGKNAGEIFEQTIAGGEYSRGALTISIYPDNGSR
ncbi:MAG: hypothetical protein WA771_10980, partial [Chthoniobacterales bacterium]